jgi:ComF family protein
MIRARPPAAAADSGTRGRRAGWRLLIALGDAVFPPRCAACGQLLAAAGAAPAGTMPAALAALAGRVCAGCRSGLAAVDPPLCTCCGVMFPGRSGEDRLCGRCQTSPPAFRMARASAVYARSMADVIRRFKYGGRTQLAAPLGELMAATFVRYWRGETIDLVLPVPLHRRRLASRGFNQALLLARRLCRHPEVPPMSMAADLLLRRRETPSQTGLPLAERRDNVQDAFGVREARRVAGRSLLLVDDVLTTGATVGECARVLMGCGAARVDVLAAARAL